MQRSGLWWAYLASFLLNCLLLLLFFTSFKFSFFSKKTPERIYIRFTHQSKSKPKIQTSSKSKTKLKSQPKSKPKSKPKLKPSSQPKFKSKPNTKPKFQSKPKVKPKAKAKAKPKAQAKPKPKPKVPVLTSTEEKLLSEKLKSLAKERMEKEKELASLRKKIEKEAELQNIEQEYRQNAIALIKQILQENFALPVYLKEKEGLFAIVSLDVDVKGEIHYRFLQMAPNEEFNQAVEECLKLSSPLPVEGPLHLVVKFKSAGLEAL